MVCAIIIRHMYNLYVVCHIHHMSFCLVLCTHCTTSVDTMCWNWTHLSNILWKNYCQMVATWRTFPISFFDFSSFFRNLYWYVLRFFWFSPSACFTDLTEEQQTEKLQKATGSRAPSSAARVSAQCSKVSVILIMHFILEQLMSTTVANRHFCWRDDWQS